MVEKNKRNLLLALHLIFFSSLFSQNSYIIAGESSGPLITPFVANANNLDTMNTWGGPPDSLMIDLDSDGNFDYMLLYDWWQGTTCDKNYALYGINGNLISDSPFLFNDTIFDSGAWGNSHYLINTFGDNGTTYGCTSYWPLEADSQYAGLKFNSVGDEFLGWMEIRVDSSNLCAFCPCISVTIGDIAYGYTFLKNQSPKENLPFTTFYNEGNHTIEFAITPDGNEFNFVISDIWGRTLKTMHSISNVEMDVSGISTGMYLVTVTKNDLIGTQKILIW